MGIAGIQEGTTGCPTGTLGHDSIAGCTRRHHGPTGPLGHGHHHPSSPPPTYAGQALKGGKNAGIFCSVLLPSISQRAPELE